VDVSAQVYMVTGVNAGLGFETARCLLKAGALVIITIPSKEQARDTTSRLTEGLVEFRLKIVCMDFNLLSSVEAGVKEFIELGVNRLDALCLNQEIDGLWEYTETEDMQEVTFQVNYLAQFYLFTLLLPTLKKLTGPKRIVIVSSFGAFGWTPDDFTVDNNLPQTQDTYEWRQAYGYSKLCNVWMAREISKRFADQDILAYSLHSGTSYDTSIAYRLPKTLYWGFRCLLAFFYYAFFMYWTDLKSVSAGTSTLLFLMTHPSDKLQPGGYYAGCKLQGKGATGFNINLAENDVESRKLWKFTESIIAAKNKKIN